MIDESDVLDDGPEPEAAPPASPPDPTPAPSAAAAEPAADWTEEDEAEARAFGWKPPSEWQGEVPPGIIADPRRYMERAESFGPFRKLRERMEAQTETLRRIEAVTAKQVERERQRAQEAYEREQAAIREAQRRAVETADAEEFDRQEKRRAALKPPAIDEMLPPQEADPVAPYVDEKPWLKDGYLRERAAAIVNHGLKSGELRTNDAAEQIAYAEKKMAVYYPHLFTPKQEARPAPRPSPVAGDILTASRRRTGFDSLPDAAKAAFKRQVAQGIFADTKEDREFFHNEYVNA